MKGTFKESKIDVIDLSSRRMNSIFEQVVGCGMVIISESDLKRYKALETSNKLLKKCLDEATEDRDKYKFQLDKLNVLFDAYIKREKDIQGKASCKTCAYRNIINYTCDCRSSDNYGEIIDSGCSCERYKENKKPDAYSEIL